ncbi:unnamed protein product [Sphenostylis stenocarpa]|uniref:Uncharacterized protein n=1 Tax=Sphenostylis stenocarpa TaxID=92480 RepID=A0AA87B9H5_9FABA|nr:unnamed protein product [Sphenostylis stenocarpa]
MNTCNNAIKFTQSCTDRNDVAGSGWMLGLDIVVVEAEDCELYAVSFPWMNSTSRECSVLWLGRKQIG